ncbi:PAS domain-containing sensor histidine kinase [Desertivirga arenae]|uniref:PAS domain-containing sensor histidine kinase n=1 Tax=Desertivirga arenae TaxID=2810309 RepID=UPI001A963016|nr:PAS domain S-box protein [Pedobacter sp. SYSU D00823]
MEKINLNQSVFQNLLENMPGMLYRCEFESGRPVLYASKGSYDLTGYFPEELIQAKVGLGSLILPEDKIWLWELFTQQLGKNEDCSCEYRIITKAGRQKWVRETATGIFNSDGILLYLEGYIVDISDKKEHQQIMSSLETHVTAMDTSERRLKALLKVIPDSLLRINTATEKCFLYSQDGGMSDYRNPDLEGPLSALFPQEIYEALLALARRSILSGRMVTHEYQLREGLDEWYYEARMMKSGEKEVMAIIRNISATVFAQKEKIKAWEALSRREDHFKAIAESSPVLIVEVDRQLKIKYINTLVARKPEEVIGQSVFFFTDANYTEIFKEKLELCFQTGEKQRLEVVAQGAFTQEEWYDINVGPVKDRVGNIESLVLLAQNITHIKTSEKEREQLLKELNHRYNELMQFNYVVSHNLRAPVANILGISYLLENGLPQEETKEVLSNLGKSAEAIDDLIRDLNDILAVRSPLNEKKELVYLQDVIQGISHDLQSQIKQSQASISTDFTEANELVSIKSYVQSILHHLISNAIKYKHPERKPAILIKAYREEESTYIEVSDNGMGIDLKLYKHQIFGLYKRFTNVVEGKGLGLHMVRSQVESMGGSISLESELGSGTVFKIRLNNI